MKGTDFLHEVDEILQKRKIVITCGTGGVGKTTLSSAMAIRAAMLGKKTVVITIDPAKRLKTALGLTELGDEPTDLTPRLRKLVPGGLKGSLEAIVPDTRRTFERFVRSIAPNPASADRLMKNPIFEIFAREFSGSNEYMALERLHELHTKGGYDCIVLDTPPSRNTLGFLRAPRILAQFFEEKLIRWLVTPANRLVAGGMRKALGILERLTGEGFMTHLLAFATSLFEMQDGFTRNLREVTRLMESSETGFVMVTGPTPETVPEARHFIEEARAHRLQFDGVLMNRTLGYLSDRGSAAEVRSPEARKLMEALVARERKVLEELEAAGIELKARLPELARDVHSVEDLFHVAMAFDADRGRDALVEHR
jgi:anion-transporting  ArsA/GET3 family ATPase